MTRLSDDPRDAGLPCVGDRWAIVLKRLDELCEYRWSEHNPDKEESDDELYDKLEVLIDAYGEANQ